MRVEMGEGGINSLSFVEEGVAEMSDFVPHRHILIVVGGDEVFDESARGSRLQGLDEEAALAQAHEKADAIAAAGAEGVDAFSAAVLEQTGKESVDTSGVDAYTGRVK